MDAFVLVLYNRDLSHTVDATKRLHEYTNVTVKYDFADACPVRNQTCKRTDLFRRHQTYMDMAVLQKQPILVLEDDFDPLPRLRRDWPVVLKFAEATPCRYDYLNLGGVGAAQFEGSSQLIHRHWMWHTQAVVYSHCNRIRDKVSLNFKGHFDWELRKTDAFMTPPLIVQSNSRHRHLEFLAHDYG